MKGSSALLWALGLAGIVFAVLNFFVGLLGAGFDTFWIGGNLVAGVILLIAAAFSSFDALRERMSSGEARRAGKYGSSAVLSAIFAVAILALLGFLSTRYHRRFDWSEQKVHSLSDQSLQLLGQLEQDVDVVALFPPVDSGPVRDLLDRYGYASPRFHVQYVDPNARPELLQKYGIRPEDLGQGLVRIALGDESTQVKDVTEENVTNALVKLSRTGEKKVYFLEGHGEHPIAGEAGGDKQGYERAAAALRNENYQVESLLLASKGDVPDDADVLVVAGPTRPLLDVEVAALDRYLARGGGLLALIDPRVNTNLIDELRKRGVVIDDDVVVDRLQALFGQPTSPVASRYDENHPITRSLREATLFHVARSVRDSDKGPFTPIVFTGDQSWGETDLDTFVNAGTAELDGKDVKGPVSVAVAGVIRPAAAAGADEAKGKEEAKAEQPEARLAVFGDSDFASNVLIEAYRNSDLFVNTVNWLMGDVKAIAIRPKLSRASRFQLSNEQFMQIRSLSLFLLPETIAVAGILVWWSRRRAPGR